MKIKCKNKSTACGTNTCLSVAINLLKCFSFQSYAPCLATGPCQDEHVIHVRGVDTFNTFTIIGCIKGFA